MKVLVTGATGFIGNYVVKELLKRDHQVIASSKNISKASHSGWFPKVNYIPFDLAAFDETINYYQVLGKADKLIHLAWEGLPNYKSPFHEEVNLPRHLAFLSNIVRNGMKDVTVTGTCFEYGMLEGCLKEDLPTLPDNPYGKAKNELRIGLEFLQNKISFSLKWIRLFYMYGKGQHPKSLLSQLDSALENNERTFDMSGGEQVRDYLPVEVMAENIVSIALQNKVHGVINSCSGQPVKIKDLVNEYVKKKNKQITLNFGQYPYPDYEPMSFWGDISKLRKALKNE
jgi:nucleoside-diphosphate-sugar epimerase